MRRVREVIVVEGRYDKNALRQVVDAAVVETGGFGVFSDRERLALLRRLAAERGFDCFTTTLTISPLKNAHKLNEICEELGEKYGVFFLPSDFKKKEGYKRSIDLSKQFELYRQNYCGCIYSKEP